MQSERENELGRHSKKEADEIAGCMNDWLTEWSSEWVTDVLKLKWNVRTVAWQGPSRPFRPTMVKRALHKLRENVTASACRTWGRVHPSFSLSLSLFCGLHPLTHCCVILLLYYSKLTVEWVKWPVQQGCCCHCCLCCSLSVSFSACLCACLSACLAACLSAHLRKEIRCSCIRIRIVTLFHSIGICSKNTFCLQIVQILPFSFSYVIAIEIVN